jgi:hypothetical protein
MRLKCPSAGRTWPWGASRAAHAPRHGQKNDRGDCNPEAEPKAAIHRTIGKRACGERTCA